MSDLPLMSGLPNADSPTGEPFVLASGSPRRKQLLDAAGYQFSISSASDSVESGAAPGETAAELVVRYAIAKAVDVAKQYDRAMIIAADTVAWCDQQILGKPRDVDHAREMLEQLSGRNHDVYTGVCIWSCQTRRWVAETVRTELRMDRLTGQQIDDYLASMLWQGKAGGFGFQDGNDWLSVVGGGSQSNIVGLPMERLAELLSTFDTISRSTPNGMPRNFSPPSE